MGQMWREITPSDRILDVNSNTELPLSLVDLPNEIIEYITTFLPDLQDILNLCTSCKHFDILRCDHKSKIHENITKIIKDKHLIPVCQCFYAEIMSPDCTERVPMKYIFTYLPLVNFQYTSPNADPKIDWKWYTRAHNDPTGKADHICQQCGLYTFYDYLDIPNSSYYAVKDSYGQTCQFDVVTKLRWYMNNYHYGTMDANGPVCVGMMEHMKELHILDLYFPIFKFEDEANLIFILSKEVEHMNIWEILQLVAQRKDMLVEKYEKLRLKREQRMIRKSRMKDEKRKQKQYTQRCLGLISSVLTNRKNNSTGDSITLTKIPDTYLQRLTELLYYEPQTLYDFLDAQPEQPLPQ